MVAVALIEQSTYHVSTDLAVSSNAVCRIKHGSVVSFFCLFACVVDLLRQPRDALRLGSTSAASRATFLRATASKGIAQWVFGLYVKTMNFHWHMSVPQFRPSAANSNYVGAAVSKPEFFVVQGIFFSATGGYADVVLPAAPSLEKGGTFTSTERRIQRLYEVLKPLEGCRPD